ncbi:DUF2085 domain-containing protein [Methanobrevibacter curvatus]|uniref:DUF2085 domain-containing protein n=1 Tax=Methanobrevibacter curvatus TaxID=49547 RepID=A0A165Z2B2_9EURY|nr:DUF2085 domain-containing protein [Methanobrevibacter curvatus]KZX10161.1 hypothetical protein MBCUR_18960 [Methanobrevibacter curvatus]
MNLICHRRKDRTFKYKNHYFPVCARCTGFYLGIISLFFLLVLFFKSSNLENLVLFGIILLIPMILDGFSQLFHLRESNNILRFITGLIGGFGIVLLLINIVFKFSFII